MHLLNVLILMLAQDSKYPTFVNMYNVMKTYPELLVEENHEGLDRVKKENYGTELCG